MTEVIGTPSNHGLRKPWTKKSLERFLGLSQQINY